MCTSFIFFNKCSILSYDILLHLFKLINLDKYTSASSVILEHNRKLNDSNFVNLT